jgi:hypothetical protein
MQMPLLLFAQWFGPWPAWIEFFVESCKWNPEIDWLILTDQDPPENRAPNVRYRKLSFADQKALIAQAIGLDLSHVKPLKLCDLKPTLGHVFTADTEGYRNYGHCDIDLIFGDIRSFYTDALLAKYEVLSTHGDRLSGHLAVLRNNAFNKTAFRRIKGWRRKVMDPQTHGIDEYRFGNVFVRPPAWRRLTERRVPALFEERYTTPLTRMPWIDGSRNYPTRWYWRNGKLTAEGYENREFIYIHFMNWKGNTSHTVRGGHSQPPWSKLDRIVSMDWRRAGADGFMISHDGIGPLPRSAVERIDQGIRPLVRA